MFKKLHSDRDPRDTVFSELRKEFSVYFIQFGEAFKRVVTRYPKYSFYLMVGLMFVSMVLSFTVFRNHETIKKTSVKTATSPISNGLSKILETGNVLKQTIVLKKKIDSLTSKQALTAQDSLTLEKALDKLRQLNQHINQ